MTQRRQRHDDVSMDSVGFYTLSAGRLGAIAGGLLGLTGIIIGVLALARPAGRFGTGSGPRGGIIALVAGLIGIALGAVVVATSDEGIGTGNGRAGAYVALVVGLIAVVLGWRAVARSRRVTGGRGATRPTRRTTRRR